MSVSTEKCLLVANSASKKLAKKVAKKLGVSYGKMEYQQFADGEHYHAFPENVAGKQLIIIGATHNADAHMELLDLIQGGRYWNAADVHVVIPYLGYSTMERARPGSNEIPKGITRTRQIFQAKPNYVNFIDLHSEAVLHAHDGGVRTNHIWSDSLVVKMIRKSGLQNYVLVSPDYGFSKRVARLASKLDCPHTAADKDRYDRDKTIVSQVSSVVKGKTAIVCDDMIRTGGSIIQTAQRCYEAGAVDVAVHATHLVLAGRARERFAASGITKVFGSDTFPGRESDELLEVYSVAPLVAETLCKYLKL